jgi:hypothetical protein
MKAKTTALILVIALTSMIMAMPALGDDTKALETRAKLEALIDRHIASCGAKIEMLDSRSDAIRTSTIRICRISTFCLTSRDALVEEMMENNVEPKSYKVSKFLNEKFKVVVLAQD